MQRRRRPPNVPGKDLAHQRPGARGILAQSRFAPVILECIERTGAVAVLDKGQVRDAALRHRQQTLAKRRGMKPVRNRQPFAFVLKLARRHRFARHEQIVQTARADSPVS